MPVAAVAEAGAKAIATSSWSVAAAHGFSDGDNNTRLVRWRFIPQDGEQRLADDEMKTAPKDFLASRLLERATRGPIRWDMLVAMGEPGDAVIDPTVAWPDDRKNIKMGTLTLTEAMPQAGASCEPINFDPLVMADSIAATDDPILQFRSPAYAVSFGMRVSGK